MVHGATDYTLQLEQILFILFSPLLHIKITVLLIHDLPISFK